MGRGPRLVRIRGAHARRAGRDVKELPMPTPLFGSLARRPLLAAALLAAALFAALPAVVSAQQPPPPAIFFGSNDVVTVGGQPWDGSPIEVIDADGAVVGAVEREGDSWSVEVSHEASPVRFRVASGEVSKEYRFTQGVVIRVYALVIGGDDRLTRNVELQPGWNWVVWTGHDQSITDALATFPDMSELSVIFERIAEEQKWGSYRPGLPAFVQSIAELRAGAAYFVNVKSALTWEMPWDGSLGGRQLIATGFTAIGWVGAEATPQEVLDKIANPSAVKAFFRYNAALQKYESYRPGLPAFTQKIGIVRPFDVLFVSATSPTTFTP